MLKSLFYFKAHSDECVSVMIDPSSNDLITVGFDGKVKIWEGLSSKCLKTFNTLESVTAAVLEKDRVLIASSSNIESFSTDNVFNVALRAQFLSEVNYMKISSDKTCFVACSSDNSAKLVQLESSDDIRVLEFLGHEGPIISIDIDRENKTIATASCDGSVIVWRARNGSKVITLEILDKFKDISQINNNCRLTFSTTKDKLLAVPLVDKITLLDCDDWSVRGNLKWKDVRNRKITECIFSEDSEYFIAGTNDGHVIIWDINSLDLVDSWSPGRGASITTMSWHPSEERTLIFSDGSGYFEALKVDFKKSNKDKDHLTFDDMNEMFEDFTEDIDKKSVASITKKDFKKSDNDKDHMTFDDMDEMFEDFTEDVDNKSVATTKEDSDEDRHSIASTTKEESEENDDEDCNFDISLIKAENNKQKIEEVVEVIPQQIIKSEYVKKTPHPFVRPGFTPCIGGIQLLLWNSVGALKKHFNDEGNNEFVEVHFHDCNVSRNLTIKPELFDGNMGDVNTVALLLVSDQDTDDDDLEDIEKQSAIYVQSIDASWQTWKTWLPVGESPVGCCLAGENYAIVLTNRGFLRYFSISLCGMQIYIESIYGIPVAIVSTCEGENNIKDEKLSKVAIVVEDGDKLMCRLEEICPGKFLNCGRIVGSIVSDWFPLPISEGCKLLWLGFSNCGTLYSVDSKQCVRRLSTNRDSKNKFSNFRWSPVLNLKEALEKEFQKTDRYFPVGFTEDTNDFGALTLHCRSSRFPRLVPWPHLTVVPFKAPLCPGSTETIQLENNFNMLHMIPDWSKNNEKLISSEKEILLKLFINALMQRSDFKAMSVAKLMPDSSVIKLAIKASVRAKKMVLSEKLGQLALSKDEEQRVIDDEDEEETEESEDNSDDKENDQSLSSDESNNEIKPLKKEGSISLEDKILNQTSPVKEPSQKEMNETPFKVSKTSVGVKRGLNFLDKFGSNKKLQSPKKNPLTFGTFVPSPKTFQIKSKRKSTVEVGSPLVKKVKK